MKTAESNTERQRRKREDGDVVVLQIRRRALAEKLFMLAKFFSVHALSGERRREDGTPIDRGVWVEGRYNGCDR